MSQQLELFVTTPAPAAGRGLMQARNGSYNYEIKVLERRFALGHGKTAEAAKAEAEALAAMIRARGEG